MSISGNSERRATLEDALIAYVGKGRLKIPTADADAVRALDPAHADELLQQVDAAIRASDTLTFAEVAPFDKGLEQRVYAKLRDLLPGLSSPGIEALGWRWGFLQFGT